MGGITLQPVSAGIDWLTTTATDNLTAKLLLREAENIQREESKRGFFTKPWRQSGYTGWQCGRIQHGERTDSAIVRLTSDLADLEWFRCYQITERATRLDVQTTFRPSCGPNPFIHRVHKQLRRHFQTWERKPKLTTWSSNDGGLTLYLGARASDVYFRCYNKEVESADEDYAGCVRMELELKNGAVKPAIDFLFATLPPRRFALELIGSFARERGIVGLISTEIPPPLNGGRSAGTDELKSLTWLSTQVRPSVINLIQRRRLRDVLNALGLSEFVRPIDHNGEHGPIDH